MNLAFSLVVICLAADEGGPVAAPVLQPAAGVLVLPSGDRRLEVSLRCPDVRLNEEAGTFGGDLPTQIARCTEEADGWDCTYSPVPLARDAMLERELSLQWYPQESVLRKWLRLRLSSGDTSVTVEEITLETLAAKRLCGDFRPGPPQSYPLLLGGVLCRSRISRRFDSRRE